VDRFLTFKATQVCLVVLVLSAVALSGCTKDEPAREQSVTGGAGTGGGIVSNTAPVLQAFTGSLTTGDNSGSSIETFSGTLFDANGERDFQSATVRVALTGAATGTFTHVVTLTEWGTLVEPSSFGSDGFKIWSGTANDGVLLFKYRYTFTIGTPAGVYTFTPAVTPSGGSLVLGTLDATTIEVFSLITIDAAPVTAAGEASAGAWGGWTASPGATNVEATNYLKLTNTGQKADATVVIDFTETVFTGSDANFTIPITNNLQFSWWEDTSPSVSAPSEGTFSYLTTNADGSVAVTFSGLNNIIYIKYRISALPAVVASQTYGAAFTATEL
jgi:hypothetical protein